MSALHKKLAKHLNAATKIQADIESVRARRRILCSCGLTHPIRGLHVLVTHWYTEPHGCTGGDYWTEGEWQFVCPVDGTRNRLMFNDYDRDWREHEFTANAFKQMYRGLFLSEEDVYRDDGTWDAKPYANNYFVDEHRKRFELPAKIEKAK